MRSDREWLLRPEPSEGELFLELLVTVSAIARALDPVLHGPALALARGYQDEIRELHRAWHRSVQRASSITGTAEGRQASLRDLRQLDLPHAAHQHLRRALEALLSRETGLDPPALEALGTHHRYLDICYHGVRSALPRERERLTERLTAPAREVTRRGSTDRSHRVLTLH